MQVYRSFNEPDGMGAAWSMGDIETAEVVAKLATRMPLTEDEILAHFARTDLFEFSPFTYSFFRARHLPQAIVTVNPTIFRQMAEDLGFHRLTDTIVVSAEERTVDKGKLCRIALQRMSVSFTPEEALLIDNRQDNLEAWAASGGKGYLYTTDEAFEQNLARGIDGLRIVA